MTTEQTYRLNAMVEPYEQTAFADPADCEFCEGADLEHEHSHAFYVMREGASHRTADELAFVFLEDAAGLVDGYDIPADIEEPQGWYDDADASDNLQHQVMIAESALASAGLNVTWDDGYVIDQVILRTYAVVPGTFHVTYDAPESLAGKVSRFAFMPMAGDAGYFGPAADMMQGDPSVDLESEDGPFWRAIQHALQEVDTPRDRKSYRVPIEWSE